MVKCSTVWIGIFSSSALGCKLACFAGICTCLYHGNLRAPRTSFAHGRAGRLNKGDVLGQVKACQGISIVAWNSKMCAVVSLGWYPEIIHGRRHLDVLAHGTIFKTAHELFFTCVHRYVQPSLQKSCWHKVALTSTVLFPDSSECISAARSETNSVGRSSSGLTGEGRDMRNGLTADEEFGACAWTSQKGAWGSSPYI